MTITEISQKYDITANTLRYYERIGLIPPVKKNASGVRDYSKEDCEWVYFIKNMRMAGISIETLIEYVTMFYQGNSTIKARKNLLIEQRTEIYEKIEELKKILERLDKKIDGYEERVLVKEENLKKSDD